MYLESGNFYHIFNRGNNSQMIFFNQNNYIFFLKKINEYLSPFASIIAWCLMPNHFHLVIYLKNSHILIKSDGITRMRTINQSIGILLRSYTRAIQKQEGQTGSLFQKHTKAKPLVDEIKIEPAYWNTMFGTQINIAEGKSYLQTCIEYVNLNPVYSDFVSEAEDWEFSSYRDYQGLRNSSILDYEIAKRENLLPKYT